ncbi:hypothetical protein ACIRRA_45425 [Nocardia sp. NPDC101769]|uniref:hypothetical protein n=1 Tax=Nocardia sp. NPDC101769 TaxID=3364333 RepID=UPI0037FA1198
MRILIPDTRVEDAAQAMVVAAYSMLDSYTSTEALTEAQDAARAAHDRFIEASAAYFKPSPQAMRDLARLLGSGAEQLR